MIGSLNKRFFRKSLKMKMLMSRKKTKKKEKMKKDKTRKKEKLLRLLGMKMNQQLI